MPVSGHEETGVKSYAGQFSGLIAGVPIKKRRFPTFQPSSSPVSGEPCSLTEETELQRKENSITSQGSALPNAAGAPIKKRRFPCLPPSLEEASRSEESDALRKEHSSTSPGSTLSPSSSGLSDANGISAFEDKKASIDVTNANMVQSNSCFLTPKLEQSNVGTQSCTLNVMDSKEKVILSEGSNKKLESQTIKGNPELLLAAKEGLALSIGADVTKQNVQDICKQETPLVSGNTSLSLSLKEHLFPAVASMENNPQKIEKAQPVSLELSLSKEDCSTHSLNTDPKTDSDTTRVHSNRANWDLNTTMDAWEESGTEAGSVKTSIDGLKISDSSLDEKQLVCSPGMTSPASVVSVKPMCEESQKKTFTFPSGLCGPQFKFVDSSNLSLAPFIQKYTEEPSRLSVKLNSGSAIPNVSLSSVASTVGDANTSSFRLVKPEPFDENSKRDLKDVNASTVGSLDSVTVKQELVQASAANSSKLSNVSNLLKVDAASVKQEPDHKGNQEGSNAAVSKMDQLNKDSRQELDNSSPSMAMPVMPDTTQISAEPACAPVKPMCTAELSTSENTVIIETVAMPMVDNGLVLNNPGLQTSSVSTEEENAADRDACRLKLMNEPPPASRGNGEGCASDEEKITLSTDMLEDDSYDSDSESDENHAVTIAVDTECYVEDDDYEDGEVREPLDPSTAEDVCEVREVEHPDSNFVNKQMEKGMVSGDCPTSYQVVEKNNMTAIQSEINNEVVDMDIEMHERSGKVVDKNVCVQESLDDEKCNIATHGNKPVNVLQMKALDLLEGKNVCEALVTESPSNQATNGSHGVDVQCADEVVKTTDIVKQTDLDFETMEVSANADDAAKDVNNGGNLGRIIDLSRATSSSSPGKTRPMSGRSLSSRAGRDVLSDTLDGDKLHRGRDEVYIDGPHKFSRERHQDISPRKTRMNFVRGRGRLNNRLDSVRNDWESDREFSGEFYNGPSQFRGPRPKYASAFADTDMEYNNVAPDGSYVGNGRLGRKPLNDGSYIAPRRRSSGGRDGIQIGHRNPRNISPNRCIGDGSDLVGVRHNEKFMRSLPEDNMDAMFTRPQTFEGMDGRFTRGSRNFSSMQRRGPPQIRSKSPIRSRSRSPGPWSSPRRRSPRRRSPDGFGGHPELTHRRSPFYRVDRMRSPDRPVFPAERVVRRHGSPSFMSRPSNDMRDMDSARDHGHPRSGRILIRNRRFDVVDPRDRVDNDDEYFGGPMHSGRLLELSGEGNGEDRRRFGERRGPVRSFRPPYNNNNVGESFHLNAEDGPRHYRFCSDDSDFHERGGNNLRERDFERRIKGRPANVPPRRTRNMDEQEENFRHGGGGGGGGGGQVWSDDSLDDISRVKRKRF
ncbi:hypothetical protein GLYMA_10G292400v4 [Glycine max]|uniref:Uncharacterized protein n=1 Tax=Glycine max TaxID=3847 RepID=A0A0R0I801_SOYBN|nr:uncharacterized protein LOC100817471 isoform X2 [Glycine max]KAH1140654.1 hypothetical protein GYH30_029504 [Glycine max]KRH36232.1 hypothetical protein GLYMA_10G292400v4 [Glycine max]|eukprot:XP_014618935.1 uncharacterized protein LOC100817471 isoform X2 [Glycine max]